LFSPANVAPSIELHPSGTFVEKSGKNKCFKTTEIRKCKKSNQKSGILFLNFLAFTKKFRKIVIRTSY